MYNNSRQTIAIHERRSHRSHSLKDRAHGGLKTHQTMEIMQALGLTTFALLVLIRRHIAY